jgi:arylsulfatase A-like enzyme
MASSMNILVLMCDHHRFDALGCMGNSSVHTPNLDRLTKQSVRFDQCYTQSPVCSPARHSLATGRYAHAQGVITNDHMPIPGMETIAHALQPLGYRRFNIGQMHWRDPNVDTGYEPWITFQSFKDAMPDDVLLRSEWESQDITRRTTAGPSPRTREQYSGNFVSQNAIRQMREAVDNDEPFLCWAAFSEPHPPFYPQPMIFAVVDRKHRPSSQTAKKSTPPAQNRPPPTSRRWSHDPAVRTTVGWSTVGNAPGNHVTPRDHPMGSQRQPTRESPVSPNSRTSLPGGPSAR